MKGLQCSDDSFAVHACDQCTGAKKKGKDKVKEHEVDLHLQLKAAVEGLDKLTALAASKALTPAIEGCGFWDDPKFPPEEAEESSASESKDDLPPFISQTCSNCFLAGNVLSWQIRTLNSRAPSAMRITKLIVASICVESLLRMQISSDVFAMLPAKSYRLFLKGDLWFVF